VSSLPQNYCKRKHAEGRKILSLYYCIPEVPNVMKKTAERGNKWKAVYALKYLYTNF